jgi:hypothetical protein
MESWNMAKISYEAKINNQSLEGFFGTEKKEDSE